MTHKKPFLTNESQDSSLKKVIDRSIRPESLKSTSNEGDNQSNLVEEPEYYAISDAARLLGVSVKTIHRWDQDGKIRCIRTLGGHRRIPASEILRLRLLRRPTGASSRFINVNHPRESPQKNPPTDEAQGSKDPKKSPKRPLCLARSSGTADDLPTELDSPPPRALNALKNQLKILRILVDAPGLRTLRILIMTWLVNFIGDLIDKYEELSSLRDSQKALQAALQDLRLQQDELMQEYALKRIEEHQALGPTLATQALPKKRAQLAEKYQKLRQQASNLFWKLYQAQYDAQRPKEERQRAQGLIEQVLAPYRRLTHMLATSSQGSLAYEICRLLLCYRPRDFELLPRIWSVRTLSTVCQKILSVPASSSSQVYRVLKKLQWYRRIRTKLLSPDPQYGEKMKQLGQVFLDLTPNDCLVFGDEQAYTSRKVREHVKEVYAPAGLQISLQKRHTRLIKSVCVLDVLGLLAPLQKRLTAAELSGKTYAAFVRTLIPLLREFLASTSGKVYVILDNAPAHRPKQLTQLLQLIFNDRVVVIFLPTHAPELNPIEQIWQLLLSAVDRYSPSIVELRASYQTALVRVQRYLATRSPKPLNLHCAACGKTFRFTATNRSHLSQSIEDHLCFNLLNFNPYVVQVLTQALERNPLEH